MDRVTPRKRSHTNLRVTVTHQMAARIREESERLDISMSWIVRRILVEYFKDKDKNTRETC